ncbi:MAG: phosphoglycolate phosphatase [Alphaproteobacteria bacterium]|nr:phosphoglycolate phosphatase [Alphaproteobacteria bacterium]
MGSQTHRIDPPVRLSALLFDLDGTLIDSAPDLAAALNRVLADRGRPRLSEATVRTLVGGGARRLVTRGFAATGGPPDDLERAVDAFLESYMGEIALRTRPYEGVVETLAALSGAGRSLAVVTNKPTRAARLVLEALDLARWFAPEHVIGGDDFPAKKPDPAPVRGALRRLGAPPEGAVMIGDSAADVGAARAAGLRSIAVGYGYAGGPAEALGADRLIARFDDLPAALDAWEKA